MKKDIIRKLNTLRQTEFTSGNDQRFCQKQQELMSGNDESLCQETKIIFVNLSMKIPCSPELKNLQILIKM